MPVQRIGFVGFGQVAATFAAPLVEHGAQVLAYDLLLEQEQGREILQRRVRGQGVQFRSLQDTAQDSDYVLSTVTTQVARQVARNCAPFIGPAQVYVDLNSTAPSIKREIADIVTPTGAVFLEGAILGAVGVTGAKTHILLGGERRATAAQMLTELGLYVTPYSPQIGQASAFKMLRSIFSKGLEALVLEFLIAGKRAGLEDELWDEAVQLMSRHSFAEIATNWITTHPAACERRFHEMVQVTETLREIGLEPVMAAGTTAFFKRSLDLGLGDHLADKPESTKAVVDFLEQCLREGTK